ncbi:MAG TPA: helix-turn-helix transcriptional regulator [Nitrososphaera sp.]|jgi:transcriptional regulator with XRE-family HTH domain|nr:helix-turn-helix transcriptional regulator [Nitrososphaera sp.]
MGKGTRQRPKRLPEKLLEIRQKLYLSQSEMVRRMGLADEIERDYISKFERGTLEPSLWVLLQYARVANVLVEVLIDNDLDLPEKLPALQKNAGIKRKRQESDSHTTSRIRAKQKR